MLHDDRNREEVRRLEDDFFDWFETADAEELEDGTLDGFLEELERVDPLPGGFDPQKSLAGFHEKYAALLDPQKEEKRQNHMSRRAFFAVAAVAAALVSMMTAQALGVDIFGFFGRWTNEKFTFTSSPDKAGHQDLFYPMEEGETMIFPSLSAAVESLNLPLFPYWLPERFAVKEAEGAVTSEGLRIYAESFAEVEGRQETLTIEYVEYGENGPIDFSKTASSIYTAGGISHYITTDQGRCTAAWIQSGLQCRISGTVTEEEMEWILDSLYYYYPTYEEDLQSREGERLYPIDNCAEAEYGSLREALDTFRVHMPLTPSWFPEDIGRFDVIGKITPRGMDVFAFSRSEAESSRGTMNIIYSEFGEDGPGFVIEKDENPTIAYKNRGITHYIMTDQGYCTATWIRENIQCIISGFVSIEEMKQIIDSIYFGGGKEAEAPSPSENQETRFDSIEEALEEFQLDIAAPKWFPERYGEFEVTGTVMPGDKSVYAWTQPDQSNFLSFSFTKKGEGVPGTVIEKDDNPPNLYESGGVQHYLLTDHEWRKAVWIQGDIECIIRGVVTEEEMKQIIDSIYLEEGEEA